MVDGLFENVWTFLNSTVWVNNAPWLMYDNGGAAAYNWTNDKLQLPVDHGLFDTTKPVSAYDSSELGYPFKTTVWEMCHGLLHQVHFTMPMRYGRPTTLDDAYNPDGSSKTLNMTYREDFVRRLVSDAYKHSPLYWHYHVRHKPSQSAMCQRTAPRWESSAAASGPPPPGSAAARRPSLRRAASRAAMLYAQITAALDLRSGRREGGALAPRQGESALPGCRLPDSLSAKK
jgi:hypothetical protein